MLVTVVESRDVYVSLLPLTKPSMLILCSQRSKFLQSSSHCTLPEPELLQGLAHARLRAPRCAVWPGGVPPR